jgi:hypothetical protein
VLIWLIESKQPGDKTMIIQYTTTEDFYYGVQVLVTKGLLFSADFKALQITLTGGY